MTEDMAAKAV